MKKLIEVIENKNGDISFNTDMKMNDTLELQTLAGRLAFNMMTKLWGGNEAIVLAVIRNLAIADLAVSVNRKSMVSFLDTASAQTFELVQMTIEGMKKDGCRIQQAAPGIKSTKKSS